MWLKGWQHFLHAECSGDPPWKDFPVTYSGTLYCRGRDGKLAMHIGQREHDRSVTEDKM